MKALIIAVASGAAVTSCNQAAEQQPSSKAEQPANAGDHEAPTIPPPGTGPDAKTPFGEFRRPVNPKSLEAAGQLVQRFGALTEQNRSNEAAKLWSSGEAAAAFTRELPRSTHLSIGEPGQAEGAAGSIYTVVPVVFTGDTFRRPAKVILRRVNDVPGSTDEQRHWHIERIDWSGPA
jgi:hypothetical protein